MKAKKRRTGYTNYDYENTFNKSLEDAEEKRLEELVKSRKIKSIYATKTIKAGNQFEVEIYPEFTRTQAERAGAKRTSNAQRNLNDKNARKRVERLINANFTEGDYWITLTYDKKNLPEDIKEALKNMKNFIRRINYRRKREGLEKAKYIYVTEWSDKKKIRCHHHLIMDSGLTMDVVEKLWKCGKRNNVRRVSPDEDGLSGLAGYITKDPEGSKRWCGSTNLKQPEERKNHRDFTEGRVKKIADGREDLQEILEKKHKNMEYIRHEIRYNEINGKFYIYARMRERRRE